MDREHSNDGDVQGHSQGDFYPAVIAQIERYFDNGDLDFTYFTVTAYGETESYSDEAEAYAAARFVAANGGW